MRYRSLITSCMLASVCLLSGCNKRFQRGSVATPPNRFDLVLDGPWILYQENQFDSSGSPISVLVAIAPDAATAEPLAGSKIYHHVPQVSTGDGYQIIAADGSAKLFCLLLDGVCAPKGPTALSYDGYTPALPLMVASNTAAWKWVDNRQGNTTLILPMPDSVSSDGVWRMRFPNDLANPSGADEPHSIGLILHYDTGPAQFDLGSCDATTPSVSNCGGPAHLQKSTLLANTGTLHIEMRAPDNNDACDLHVREAYIQAFNLLSSSTGIRKYIEPAQYLDANGDGVYDSSSCDDPQNNPGAYHPPVHPKNAMMESPLSGLLPLLNEVENDKNVPVPAQKASRSAQALIKNLDKQFPRLSQLRLISSLMNAVADQINSFLELQIKSGPRIDGTERDKLKGWAQDTKAGAPKNGNDCKAETILVTPPVVSQ